MPGKLTTDLRLAFAVLLFLLTGLIFRSWIQTELQNSGVAARTAGDLSYFIVPLVVVCLSAPLRKSLLPLVINAFTRQRLTTRTVFLAVSIGVLLRLIWWCHVALGVGSGWYSSADQVIVSPPQFAFHCPDAPYLLLGISVTVLLIPLVEETIHRVILQSALMRFGAASAILTSASIFAVLHGNWGFAFFAGLVFGCLYMVTGSIWHILVAHMTVNGLVILDSRCLSLQWTPAIDSLPLWRLTILAAITLIISMALLVTLMSAAAAGAREAPRHFQSDI